MEADRWIERVGSQRSHLPEMAELAALEEELRELIKALREAQAAQNPVRTAYEDALAGERATSRRPSRRRPRTRANSPRSKMSSSTCESSWDVAKIVNSSCCLSWSHSTRW